MAFSLFVLVLFTSVISFIFWHFYYKRRGLPPGPIPLPFVGNLLELSRSGPGSADVFTKWRHQYGPIYTFWLGKIPVVCVADHRKMVEMFQRDGETYATRPEGFKIPTVFTAAENESTVNGILASNGAEWREQRRFAVHVFRDLGLGKSRLEEHILEDIELLCQKIDAKLSSMQVEEDFELDLMPLIDLTVGSTINGLLFGHGFDDVGSNETEYWQINRGIAKYVEDYDDPRVKMLEVFPFLIKVPYFKKIASQLDAQLDTAKEYIERKVTEYKEKLALELEIDRDGIEKGEDAQPSRDYAEAFLRELAKKEANRESDHYFSIEQLNIMCFELWMAGQLSTSLVFAWGFAHLLHHPEYLACLKAEMDEIIGSPERIVTMADRAKLPYTNAVVNECLRMGSLVLSNIPHTVTKDVQLDGFTLPKGTWIIPQMTAIFSDDAIYPEAHQFNPGHHLDEEGRFRRRDEFIPFGIGKRNCPGESLARMELFLLMANIFNRYKFSPGKELPSLKCCSALGIANKCPPFTCRMKKR